MRQTPPEILVDLLDPFWPAAGVDSRAVATRGRAWLVEALPLFVERSKTLLELARAMAFLFAPPAVRDPKAEAKFLTPAHRTLLGEIRRLLAEAPDFKAETLEELVRRQAAERGRKLVDYAQPVRVALTGTTISPPLFPVLGVLGREVVLDRLDEVLKAG
jgi:glutamyl-tRNA synthetase